MRFFIPCAAFELRRCYTRLRSIYLEHEFTLLQDLEDFDEATREQEEEILETSMEYVLNAIKFIKDKTGLDLETKAIEC